MNQDNLILDVKDLKMYFPVVRGLLRRKVADVKAVDGVTFKLMRDETLGLVGESGCGKTTIGRCIIGLYRATGGQILFEDEDITSMSEKKLREVRRNIALIFQDPYSSLDPRQSAGGIVGEPLKIHNMALNKGEYKDRVEQLLRIVGLDPSMVDRFPHEFSGGQRQRIGVARALACDPSLIICDEPISALDVSIQAQVVNLLRDLQKQLGLSYLFISHDLRVVELISHKVAVMYLGKIVEIGLSDRIANKPSHPYTHILWSSLVEKQSKETAQRAQSVQAGRWGVFDFERPNAGCRFAPRCPVYESKGKPTICTDPTTEPQLKDIGDTHQVACHFPL